MTELDNADRAALPVSPALMMGAASPLWSYFAVAAAGGLAFWWMTRWTRPLNLEALYGQTLAVAPMATPEHDLEPAAGLSAELAADLTSPTMVLDAMPEVMTEPDTAAAPQPPALEVAQAEPEAELEPEIEPRADLEAEPELNPEPEPEPSETQLAPMFAETPEVVSTPQADFAPPMAAPSKSRGRKPDLLNTTSTT